MSPFPEFDGKGNRISKQGQREGVTRGGPQMPNAECGMRNLNDRRGDRGIRKSGSQEVRISGEQWIRSCHQMRRSQQRSSYSENR